MDGAAINALIQNLAEQSENARQQNAALGNLIGQLQAGQQGQTELLTRLLSSQSQTQNGVNGSSRGTDSPAEDLVSSWTHAEWESRAP